MEMRWCVNCLEQTKLDKHGRCDACGSDAVARIGPVLSSLTTQEGAQTLPGATRPVKLGK